MLKKTLSVILALVFTMCIFVPAFAEGDDILPDNAVIVIAEKASATDKSAAQIIQKNLAAVTGIKYDILPDTAKFGGYIISVGNNTRFPVDTSDLDDGGYRIKAFKNGVSIAGEGNRGTLYGAYAFLEKCAGCHCYTASMGVTSDWDKVVIPDDLDIEYNVFFEYTDTDWISPTDVNYSVANGLNGSPYRTIPAELGGNVKYISRFCHTLTDQFCSRNKYFDEHPEYFALRGGKRTGDQLCLCNEDVVNIVIDEVLELLSRTHDPAAAVEIISLTQADNQNYCECAACKALDEANGSHAGTMITFINKVAKAVKAAGYTNTAIDTFAYQYTRHAPTAVKPDDNVIVRFCTIEGCFAHSFDDDSCKYNADIKKDLVEWGKICNRIYVWDYTTNYARTLGIFPDFGVLQKNMQFFYENNVKGVYEEGAYYARQCDTEFAELRAYLLARLMVDPYCDYSAEMNGFLKAYYGSGWQQIRTFIDMTSEKCVKDGNKLGIYNDMGDTLDFSKDDIERADDLWEKAKKLSADEPEALANIERSEISWRYWKCCNNVAEFSNIAPTKESASRELYEDIVALGVTRFNEGSALGEPAEFGTVSAERWYEGNKVDAGEWILTRFLKFLRVLLGLIYSIL